jgi:hypothetical protein
VFVVAVAHGDKVRQELTARILNGEIALVLAHDRNQHITRQFKEALVKGAAKDGWLLNQVGDFFKQRGIVVDSAADLLCQPLHTFPDDLFAEVLTGNDAARFDGLHVIVGVLNGDWL